MANYCLFSEQSDVMLECLNHVIHGKTDGCPMVILSANAGSGKTYTVNVAARVLKKFGYTGTAIAFTGKAVTQLQKSGLPARTFHSLMYTPVINNEGECTGFNKRSPDEVKAEAGDYIILDESSMIPLQMFKDLAAIGLPVIAVGDVAQLPPIDQNNPDFNLMTSVRAPRLTLHTNRRTDPSYSGIVHVCEHFRRSNTLPQVCGEGFDIIPRKEITTKYFRDNEFDGIIVGTNKTRKAFTEMVRRAKGVEGDVPEVGETVMCLRNAFVNDVYIANGELFKVEAVFPKTYTSVFVLRSADDPKKKVTVEVVDEFWTTEKMPNLPKEQMMKYQQFTFGYVATCWKWQGSSLDRVLFVDEDISFFGDQQKFRYTAVSRAAKHLVYVI